MKPAHVLIGRITAEMPRFYEYYDSIDSLILPPNTKKVAIHSSSPAVNRNAIIKIALQHDFTHIFFTDDDHIYPPDTVMRLLARDVDIVTGLYCRKFPPFDIIVMDEPLPDGNSHFIDLDKISAKPGDLLEYPRIPAGCLLIKMEVFRKLPYPWFTIGQIVSTEWGDDLWFCDRVIEAGLKIHIDTSVCVGHITKCILTPEYVNGKWIIRHQINSLEGLEVLKPGKV